MKQLRWLAVISVLLVSAAYGADEQWKLEKSTHFVVYYLNASPSFVKELISRSENLYTGITDSLGFRRYDFWLWDDRAKLYIFDTAAQYQSATGQPAWSSGAASPRDKVIYTFTGAKGFFEVTLPHELGHIVFREFVGYDNRAVPVWLDEGVASYQGYMDGTLLCRFLNEARKKGTFIPLSRLSGINPYILSDEATVQLFYAESAGVVYYLIKEYGKERFVTFCQALRDKKDLARALASAFSIATLKDLNQDLEEFLEKQ